MATDIERLVVQLSADVRGYQKALDRAARDTDRAARGIEGRFNRMNRTVNSGFSKLGSGLKGIGVGFLAGLSVERVVSGIGEIIKSTAALVDQAKKAGVSAEELQAFGFAAQESGAGVEELGDALSKLNVRVAEAKRTGKGALVDLFAANNLTISDKPIENLLKIADLIRNAKTEIDKAAIASAAFGARFGAQFIQFLEQGSGKIREVAQSARDTGKVIDEELVKKADEFDDAWNASWTGFRAGAATAVIGAIAEFQKLFSQFPRFEEFLKRLNALTPGSIILNGPPKQGLFENFQSEKILEQDLVDLAKERADLEDRIAKLKSSTQPDVAGLLPGAEEQLQRVNDELTEVQKRLAEIQNKKFNPLSGISVPGATATTAVPSSLDEAGEKIEKSADKFESVIDKFARDVAVAESGGNAAARNPLSTATGLGQFIESTWIEQFQKAFPDRAAGLTRAGILALRTNAQVSFDIIKSYARDNARVLQAAGQSVTEANLQLAHFLGPKGAVDVLKAAPGTPVAQVLPQNVIAANQGVLGGQKTVDDVIAYAEARTRATEADKAGKQAFDNLLASHQEGIGKAQLENQLFGDTSLAAEKLRIEYELLAEAKRALGRELLPDEVEKIKATAGAMAEQTVKARELAEAQEQSARSAEEFAAAQAQAQQTIQAIGGAFQGALQGFINDLIQGKDLTDALRDSLINLGQSLLNIALDNLFSGLFGGAGARGGFGSLFHAGSKSAGFGGPSRRVSRETFLGAPRYHSGGFAGLKPGEIPAILKQGEPIGPEAVDAAAKKLISFGALKFITQGDKQPINATFNHIYPTPQAAQRSANQAVKKEFEGIERIRRTA